MLTEKSDGQSSYRDRERRLQLNLIMLGKKKAKLGETASAPRHALAPLSARPSFGVTAVNIVSLKISSCHLICYYDNGTNPL